MRSHSTFANLHNDSNNVNIIHLNICFDNISLLRLALVIHSWSVSRMRPSD